MKSILMFLVLSNYLLAQEDLKILKEIDKKTISVKKEVLTKSSKKSIVENKNIENELMLKTIEGKKEVEIKSLKKNIDDKKIIKNNLSNKSIDDKNKILNKYNTLSSIYLNCKEETMENKLYVYLNEDSLIKQKFSVKIPSKGKYNLLINNISNDIIKSSVSPLFSNLNAILYSQNIDSNLITFDKLLINYIGKNVDIKEGNNEYSSYKLISTNPILVLKKNRYEQVQKEKITFKNIPLSMSIKPRINFNILLQESGFLNIDLKYLTKGIKWKDEYMLEIKNNVISLKGWKTIENNTNLDLKNTSIIFNYYKTNNKVKDNVKKVKFKNKFKIKNTINKIKYSSPFKVDLSSHSKKQINFLDIKDIKYKDHYETVVFSNDFPAYGVSKYKFNEKIKIENTKDNNLGLFLPKGNINLYKDNNDVGKDILENSKNNDTILLNLGNNNNILLERKEISRLQKKEGYVLKENYKLFNKSQKSQMILITKKLSQTLQTSKEKKFSTTCKDNCSYEFGVKEHIFKILLKSNTKYTFKTEDTIY